MVFAQRVFVLFSIVVLLISHPNLQLKAQDDGCDTLIGGMDANNIVYFTDPQSGEIIRQEQLTDRFSIRHSPDCRFLIGQLSGYHRYGECPVGLIIWDAHTGERLQTFEDGFCDTITSEYPRFRWKPDYSAVIISERYDGVNVRGIGRQNYIWFPSSNQRIPLQLQVGSIHPDLDQVYWDDTRGWFWTSGWLGVAAFDVTTGQQIANFYNPPKLNETDYYYKGTASSFTFSMDMSKVVVHGQRTTNGYTNPSLTVYDIASGNSISVNPELNGAGNVALSPDNRYLIMAYSAIRVWDLQSLSEAFEDRLPIHRLGLPNYARSYHIYFADNTTLVAESDNEILRWNVQTGERIQ